VYFKSSRFVIGLAAAAVGLGVTVVPATAQQSTFHLPFKAHWGRAVLEPGDYRISTPLGASGAYMIHLSGQNKSNMLVPAVTQIQNPSNRSYLEFVNVDGEYFLRDYKQASGQAFHFGIPKVKRERSTLSASARAVPVHAGTR
jgi:hypothetical protein